MEITSKGKQYIVVFAVTAAAVMIYLFCHHFQITQPISIEQDKAIDNFIKVTAMESDDLQTGVIRICEYNIQNIIMLLLIKICGNVWAGINIYYICTFFMISFAMYHFLNKMEIPVFVSIGMAVLSAFLPFHVDRGEGQMLTSNFFLAPLFMSMFYEMIYCKKTDAKRIGYTVLVCLAPFVDVRISVMACIIFCVLLIQRNDLRLTKYAMGYFVPLVLFSGFVGIFASTLKISDIETAKGEGLRILDMVMPMRYHAVRRLSDMRLDYDIMLSAHGEAGLNSLGVLFSFGFACLMFGLFFEWKRDRRIAWMGMISMFVILTAGICGLGSVLDYLGLHVIYWSRMAVFIVVSSVAVIGILTGKLYSSIKEKYGKRALYMNCAVIYLVFIVSFFELIIRQNM